MSPATATAATATELHALRERIAGLEQELARRSSPAGETLALALEGAELGTWDWNIATGEATYSDRWATMLGFQPGDLAPLHASWERLVHPADRLRAEETLAAHLAGSTPFWHLEHRLRAKRGDWVWVLTHGRVCEWDAAGRPLRAAGIHQNITARKQGEELVARLLQQTAGSTGKAFFAAVVEQLAAALDVRYVAVAERVGPDRMRTLAFWQADHLVPNVEHDLADWPCQQVLERGEVCHYPDHLREQFPLADSLITLEAESYYGVPLKASDGTVLGHLCILDTEPLPDRARLDSVVGVFALRAAAELQRQRSEQTLSETSERLQAIVQAAPLPIVALTPAGEITLWNGAAERLFGWTAAEVVGGPLPFIPADKLEEHRRMRAQDLAGAGFVGREIRRRRKDGALIDLSVSTAPTRNASGEVSGIMSVYVDVTARKADEAALAAVNAALRHVNQELEQFSYAASHDLQEPLRTVASCTELLLRRHIPAGDAEAGLLANFIQNGVARMQALVRDLLTYSRVVHDDASVRETASLDEALGRAREALAARLGETGANIDADALPDVQGDTAQLAQVFQNLLSNALKYQRRGVQPAIRVRAWQYGGTWQISVQDNGIGFDPKHAERIFGLFKRLHRDEYPGTGVGLGICQRIVERHGGRIWAESAGEGQGATFSFTLPAARPARS